MKKALSVILGLAFLLSVLFTPFASQATTNDEQSVEELIASLETKIANLKSQINELLAQLETIKGQRGDTEDAPQLTRRLRIGMRGDDIKLLQEFLATDFNIYPEGLVTGYFGRLTEAAVTRFQAKMGVEQVGIVGPKTFSKINELLTEGAGSSGKVPPGLLIAPGIQKKISFFFVPDITEPEDEEEIEEESEEVTISDASILKEEKSLKQIVYGFLGTPYERGPLGEREGEKTYRTDVFDCTTLVLVVASKFNSNGTSPEEMMKQANYYPSNQISYENRLHFSSYRNQVSPLFRDITEKVGKEKTKTKQVILNKDRGEEGRIIDIDWEQEINLKYIAKEDVSKIISFLPMEIGVAFMVDGDEKIGLDVRHEGFLFNGEKLVHASSKRGKVFEEDFLNLLEKSSYTGVIFFEVVAIDDSF